MALDTIDSLVEALRARPILRPEQFQELLRVHVPLHPNSTELARTLIRLKWLTIYQAKKIVAGKADELVIGQYVILDKLGEGGMGKVFKATQLSLNRVVALKVVRNSLLKNETALKRFRREVKAAADLNHPNIVRVFDADQIGDKHFLAMEYIPGFDLARLVKDRGALPIDMACSCIRQAALGLQHAHDRRMVHRDIKPSNLLIATDAKGQITTRSVVKLLDMGLARVNADEAGGEHLSTELTRTGTVIGTPDFMSPEQAKNSSAVDHRSDLYSLGCTFYYLLTGDAPFTQGNPLEKLLQHQMDPPRPIQLVRMETPHEVATIVHCLLAKRPDDRFQSGAALAHALEPWCASVGNSALQPGYVLKAEAVDASSATIDTMPHDPFDFDAPTEPATPLTSPAPPPLPRHTATRSPRWPWIAGLAALFLVFMTMGAIAMTVLNRGKKPGEVPSPGVVESTKSESAKTAKPKVDQPTAPKELDSLDRFLPNEATMVWVFDVKQWQTTALPREMIVAPLAKKLAGVKFLTGVDLMGSVERVLFAAVPDDQKGDVVILQGRSLVSSKLMEAAKTLGILSEPAWDKGPELYVLEGKEGKTFVGIAETSIVLSSSRDRIVTALQKREGLKRTKFEDPSIDRALEYAQVRPFAIYATLGVRQGWALTQPAAAKINFIAGAIAFEEQRGMHFSTFGDETEAGKIVELQRAFAEALSMHPNADDGMLERIIDLLRNAKPTEGGSKNRRAHAYYQIPSRKLDDWLAPFAKLVED